MAETSAKTALIQFLQKHIGRTLTRHDITYSAMPSLQSIDGSFEATVTLACLNSESYVGDPGTSEKEAQHNAARKALDAHAHEVANLPVSSSSVLKRPRRSAKSADKKPHNDNPKTKLIQFLQKYLARTLTAADLQYDVSEVAGQFQASLTVVCLNGEYFSGGLEDDAKGAERSVAQEALTAHSADIERLQPFASLKAPQLKAQKIVPVQRQKISEVRKPALAQVRVTAPVKRENSSLANNKTKLSQFLQSHIGRALTREDVVYTLESHGPRTKAVVALKCLGSHEFAGQHAADEKSAQQAAAAAALKSFSKEVAAWESARRPSGPQVQATAPVKREYSAVAGLPDSQGIVNNKTMLIRFLQSHIGRTLTKEDVVYTLGSNGSRAKAVVSLECLGGQQFAGEDAADEKAAQQAAAAAALHSFSSEVAAWKSAPPKNKKPRR